MQCVTINYVFVRLFYNLLACILCSALSAGAQQLENDCRTPLGIPCYTIRSTSSQWQNFKDGVTDIQHYSGESVHAVRRDGSFVGISSYGRYVFLKGTSKGSRWSSMYLAPQDQVVRVNHTEKTISYRAPLIWHDRPYRNSADGDSNCRTGILHAGTDFTLAGNSTVAGTPVVKWIRGNWWNTEEIYLAPSLDCRSLKIKTIRHNRWYMPVFVHTVEATSVELGEPKPEFFSLPSDYRQVEDPHERRLRERMSRSQ